MNQYFSQYKRCVCQKGFFTLPKPVIKKKRKIRTRKIQTKKPLYFGDKNLELKTKTFQIKYEKKLSSIDKIILNSFHNKYVYYAIDDILELVKTNSNQQNNLLAILYSPILSLQNNFFINFFDIWIQDIYIEEIYNNNKFLQNDSQILKPVTYITITLLYYVRLPAKKTESLW